MYIVLETISLLTDVDLFFIHRFRLQSGFLYRGPRSFPSRKRTLPEFTPVYGSEYGHMLAYRGLWPCGVRNSRCGGE